MKPTLLPFFMCMLGMAASSNAYAEDAKSTNYSNTLTGNWGGKRTELSNKGVDIDASYTGDLWRNAQGGADRGNASVNALDVKVAIDGEKLYNLKGSRILIEGMTTAGSNPNKFAGTWQNVDNRAIVRSTQENSTRLYQAWIEQSFNKDKASVKLGIYDPSTEFYVTDSSRLFLGTSYTTGWELTQTGQNGPSVFPVTGLGVRTHMKITEHTYFQTAFLDGVPGNPNKPEETDYAIHDKDGTFKIIETGYKSREYGHYAIGFWHYSGGFDDLTDVNADGSPIRRHNNQGQYILLEKELVQHLTGFARIGIAQENVNGGNRAWSAGLVYDKLIPGRQVSELGFGVSSAHNSPKWNDLMENAGNETDNSETILELTYRDTLTPWLSIQPDIQYIINPNTDPAQDNALLIGARFKVNF